MFCTQCGKQAAPEHVFCSGCGTRLLRGDALPAAFVPQAGMAFAPAAAALPEANVLWTGGDWRETTDYRDVLGRPEVKALIAEAAKANKAGMTADEFIKLAQPLLDASGGGGVPMKLIMEMAQPMYAKMGIKTGKETRNGYASPFGRTLAAILCALASRQQRLVAMQEGTDGCIVQADVPSSVTTGTGKLTLTLERKAEGTLVSSAVLFEGQSSDWGRSKRLLDDLHQDILNFRSLQT
jgi:hypothetical protein